MSTTPIEIKYEVTAQASSGSAHDSLYVFINGRLQADAHEVRISNAASDAGLPLRVIALESLRALSGSDHDFDAMMARKDEFEVQLIWAGCGRACTMSRAHVVAYEARSFLAAHGHMTQEHVVIHAPWQPFH